MTPRKPSVVVQTISEEEEFLLRSPGNVRTQEQFSDEGGDRTLASGATITHTRPGRVLMWKPMGDGRYTPRIVSGTSRAQLLDNGWKVKCPACNTNHEASPYPPGDANACPAREAVASRFCPVCGKHITDDLVNMQFKVELGDLPDAEKVIQDESEMGTTPASRTRVQLDRHLWQFHPRSAEMMGRPPLPVATRSYDGSQRPI